MRRTPLIATINKDGGRGKEGREGGVAR